jgi:hypothetical protein
LGYILLLCIVFCMLCLCFLIYKRDAEHLCFCALTRDRPLIGETPTLHLLSIEAKMCNTIKSKALRHPLARFLPSLQESKIPTVASDSHPHPLARFPPSSSPTYHRLLERFPLLLTRFLPSPPQKVLAVTFLEDSR